MRKITHIVLHCTATTPFATVSSIQRYWREEKKWKNPGYHFIIDANGTITQLADLDKVTNGVAGHNANAIHVAYIGGVDNKNNPKDTRTPMQLSAMAAAVKLLKAAFPKAKILGHRDFPKVAKACPSFDVKHWLEHIGLKQ